MDYELAKKLKEAGFPQENREYYWEEGIEISSHSDFWNDGYQAKEYFANPTLSEMIEACGDRFSYLSRTILQEKGKKWNAGSSIAHGLKTLNGMGDTPEEAVALLLVI